MLALVWGASFLFIKVSVQDMASVDVALGRTALGALTLLALLAASGGLRGLNPQPTLLGHWFVVAVLANTAPFMLIAEGETRISSVLAGLWNATTPLMTLLVATAVLPEERPTRRRLAGFALGFLGAAVVLGPWDAGSADVGGQLMVLGAAACYGCAFPYTRRYLAGRPEPTMVLMGGQLVIATLQLAIATAFVGAAPGALGIDTVLSMLGLGCLGTGAAYILNFEIVREAGATTASTITYVVPVVATALGVIVLGEGLVWNQPVGAAVVLAGVIVASSAPAVRAARATPAPP